MTDETGRPVLHLHAAFGEAVVIELTDNEAVRRVDPATGFELLDA